MFCFVELFGFFRLFGFFLNLVFDGFEDIDELDLSGDDDGLDLVRNDDDLGLVRGDDDGLDLGRNDDDLGRNDPNFENPPISNKFDIIIFIIK